MRNFNDNDFDNDRDDFFNNNNGGNFLEDLFNNNNTEILLFLIVMLCDLSGFKNVKAGQQCHEECGVSSAASIQPYAKSPVSGLFEWCVILSERSSGVTRRKRLPPLLR